MKSTIKTYEGDGYAVTYDIRRCIHAESCVHGMPRVFDRNRKPWIDPRQGAADEIAEVVYRCPTGALKFEKHGEVVEPEPAVNQVRVGPDGPLYVSGRVTVREHDETVVLREHRVAFCRCGLSANKPLCDDSHYDRFTDPGHLGQPGTVVEEEPTGEVVFTARRNGALRFEGALEIVGEDGVRVRKTKGAFCRCGQSRNKPFCDGTHKEIAFRTDADG